jgi:hypothetical protein
MPVSRRVAARAVFDEHALDALARTVRQLVLVDDVRNAWGNAAQPVQAADVAKLRDRLQRKAAGGG